MKLLQVKLDDELMRELRIVAAKQDTNVSEIVRAAIAGFILEETKV